MPKSGDGLREPLAHLREIGIVDVSKIIKADELGKEIRRLQLEPYVTRCDQVRDNERVDPVANSEGAAPGS